MPPAAFDHLVFHVGKGEAYGEIVSGGQSNGEVHCKQVRSLFRLHPEQFGQRALSLGPMIAECSFDSSMTSQKSSSSGNTFLTFQQTCRFGFKPKLDHLLQFGLGILLPAMYFLLALQVALAKPLGLNTLDL